MVCNSSIPHIGRIWRSGSEQRIQGLPLLSNVGRDCLHICSFRFSDIGDRLYLGVGQSKRVLKPCKRIPPGALTRARRGTLCPKRCRHSYGGDYCKSSSCHSESPSKKPTENLDRRFSTTVVKRCKGGLKHCLA